jgi:hypothetical protein
MNINANACPYRHTLSRKLEAVRVLRHKNEEAASAEMLIPSEGHITVSI